MSFEYPIELPSQVKENLSKNGIERPFPVQTHSALPLFELKSLKILAPTGSGKTLAYLLPLGKLLSEERDRNLIVLGSSPELVAQISNVFRDYFPDLDAALIVGGANLRRQKDKMKTRPKAVFATPGRLFELFCLEYLKIDDSTTLVLDECDSLIAGNNYEKVFSLAEGAGQLVTASATFNEDSLSFLNELPQNIEDVEIKKREGSVKHSFVFCNDDKKEISLIKALRNQNFKNCLIFVNDIRHVKHLASELRKNHFSVATLDSSKNKNEREKAVKSLKEGVVSILVTTDSLARGLDFVDLAAVIQYGIARDEETYVHRSGRVGRAGAKGWCISLVSKKDSFVLFKYVKSLGLKLAELSLASPKEKIRKKNQETSEPATAKKKKKKKRVDKDKGKRRKKL